MARSELEKVIAGAKKEADLLFETARKTASVELKQVREQASKKLEQINALCVEAIEVVSALTIQQEQELILAVEAGLEQEKQTAQNKMAQALQVPLWKRALLLDSKWLEASVEMGFARRRAKNWKHSLYQLQHIQMTGARSASVLFELALGLGYGTQECENYLSQLKDYSDRYRAKRS